jgi:transposase
MEIGISVMRRWGKQLQNQYGGQTPSNSALTVEQRRIQKLEAQVKKLERKTQY